MDNFHRRRVAGVAVTATRVSAILTENRYKKREVLLAVSSKNRKYRAVIMVSQIVSDNISREKTTQQVYFADEQVYTMQDFSMPQTFLSKNRHSSNTAGDFRKRWVLSIPQISITLKSTTQKMTRCAIIPLARRYRSDQMFDVRRIHGTMSNDTMDARCQSIHNENYCQVFGSKKIFLEANPI